MYVRFTVIERDADSHESMGLFAAPHDLLEDVELPHYAREHIRGLLDWFSDHLRVLPGLKKGRNPQAICWFRATAAEHIGKMWEFVWVLRGLDFRIRRIKSDDPGRIIYADEFQVAASPRSAWKRAKGRRRTREAVF